MNFNERLRKKVAENGLEAAKRAEDHRKENMRNFNREEYERAAEQVRKWKETDR